MNRTYTWCFAHLSAAYSQHLTDGRSRAGFTPMIYSSWGIFNNFCLWNDVDDVENEPLMLEALKSIAYINVKKLLGHTSSKNSIIQAAYNQHKKILQSQISGGLRKIRLDLYELCNLATLPTKFTCMSIFSIFSEDKNFKIQNIKKTIENHKKSIENEKMNLARYKAANAPKHYQDSGTQKIAHFNNLIASCKAEITRLKMK